MRVVGRRLILSALFWLLIGIWSNVLSTAEESPAIADTRILIDISGSMKQNDPNNLRRPALRLLVGLLPAESRAGVWTFGQYVNMQVPLGKVDQGWRAKAREGAGKIHSRGLFTNIEEALQRSTGDWQGQEKRYQRHLVLLTDGVVDVSKDQAESAASRARIIGQVLPALQARQVRVHTIALSDRADHELLRTLSGETGGWYEQVQQAAQLQRVFLRIFEKVGQPDTLPLKDNKFHVDDSIGEATLLVFRAAGAPATRVVSPNGAVVTADNARAGFVWHRDEGYDLITITRPEPGEWGVQAALDPDNRVVVVTDLRMRASDLPNRILLGEQVPLVVDFTEKGSRIVEQAFLELVNLSGETIDLNGASEPRPILDDGRAGDEAAADGGFTWMLGDLPAEGRVELVVSAEGKTFQRQQRRLFELVSPVTVEIGDEADGAAAPIRIQLSPDPELLEPESIAVRASLVSRAGEQQPLTLQRSGGGNDWVGEVDPASLSGSWQLGIEFSAKSLSGNPVTLNLEPLAIEGKRQSSSEPAAGAPQAEARTMPEADGWVMSATMFGAGNAVALLLGAGVYFFIRRRRAKDQVKLVEDEKEEASADEQS